MTAPFMVPQGIYLQSHSLGPLPATTPPRVVAWIAQWAEAGARAMEGWWGLVEAYRAALARLLGGHPRGYCPQPNVSAALARWLGSLPESKGREQLVLTSLEFPTAGFVASKARRMRHTILPFAGGAFDLAQWKEAMTSDVLAAIVSHVPYGTGTILPVREMVAHARERGVRVVVDVAQSAGVVPIDVEAWQADAVVGTCVKWLCGGPGTGFLWVNPESVAALDPTETGWLSQEDLFAFDIHRFTVAADARRFLGGTPGLLPYVTATAGLEQIAAIGVERVRAWNLALTTMLLAGARGLGISPRFPTTQKKRSGTVVLRLDDAERTVVGLRERKISADQRDGCLRLSPHVFNTEEEIQRVIDALGSLLGRRGGAHA
jgi:selenocysteine lyase/cysteine desulfurase